MKLWIFILCFALSPFCTAEQNAMKASDKVAQQSHLPIGVGSLEVLLNEIERFVEDTRVTLPTGSEAVALEQRLHDGFQQDPPRRLQLNDNSEIFWGWQHGQAFVKSVAVYDAQGSLRLVGAIDNIPSLYSTRAVQRVENDVQYQKLLRKYASWGSEPSVVLFAHQKEDFNTFLPLIKRYLQAAMLGFNVDCAQAQAAPSCAFAQTVTLPMVVYKLDCQTSENLQQCVYPLPDAEALPVPLSSFKQ